ncbi:MAG: DUF3943 domain-containing protein [Bacteroidota bacterium]
MKTSLLLVLFLVLAQLLSAQNTKAPDSIIPAKGNTDKQLEKIIETKTARHSDSLGNEPKKSALIDTTIQNKYGDLLNDDTAYNLRHPIWKPSLQVLGAVVLTWSIDRLILNADYAHIGIASWKYNMKYGWEWDNDRFGVNFVGHPYSGTLSYNAARSNGYNFYQSIPFAVAGSLMWEYFGENTRPSCNDIINTPVSGVFLGEILYRLSSNILDDRTKGTNRVLREIAAGIIDPMRGFNRLMQGKCSRVTNVEVYQKEPLNISLYSGLHRKNTGTSISSGTGTNSMMVNAQFDYGNPFEIRKRKPFDFFKLRVDLDFGVGRKFLDDITGYGILFGKNRQIGNLAILVGGFQYYDYMDNMTFELGTIGLGGGLFTKLPINSSIDLYTNLHLALVPFAGNSTRFGPDTSQLRDYNYGAGLEGKFESIINLGKFATASLIYYYYMVHTYVGAPGNNIISILKPRVTVKLFKQLSLGFEHFIYFNDRYLDDFSAIHSVRTEQKIFLQLYLEDKQRKGHYN